MHEYTYKITDNLNVKLLDYNRPEKEIILPNITISKEMQSISIDFQYHIIDICPNKTIFLHIVLNPTSFGILLNHTYDDLDFTSVNERCSVGILNPEYYMVQPINNNSEYIIVDYGRFVFTLKEAIISYYASPLSLEDLTYFYRVFNHPGINQGAVLVQKGDHGFGTNSFTMFLNTVTMTEISMNRLMLDEDDEEDSIIDNNVGNQKKIEELYTHFMQENDEILGDLKEEITNQYVQENQANTIEIKSSEDIKLGKEELGKIKNSDKEIYSLAEDPSSPYIFYNFFEVILSNLEMFIFCILGILLFFNMILLII